jgi:hypothetical protein
MSFCSTNDGSGVIFSLSPGEADGSEGVPIPTQPLEAAMVIAIPSTAIALNNLLSFRNIKHLVIFFAYL